jgi:hypothetical protein
VRQGDAPDLLFANHLGSWHDQVRNTHQSHELRVSTPDESHARGTAGAYWEKFVIADNMNFNYMTHSAVHAGEPRCLAAGGYQDCVAAVGPIPGYLPPPIPACATTNTAFGEDVHRGYKQRVFRTSSTSTSSRRSSRSPAVPLLSLHRVRARIQVHTRHRLHPERAQRLLRRRHQHRRA